MLFQICLNLDEDKMSKPMDLKKLNKIYTSFFSISSIDQPIITYDYVYFISNEKAKGFNYKNLIYSIADVFELYGNTLRKPLLYINTPLTFSSIFF